MSKIPNEPECIQILLDNHVPEDVILHCIKVMDVSLKIAERCGADRRVVTAGALLHDIGRSVSHDLTHAPQGAEILERLGIQESIVSIVRKHTGAGFTADEAESMGFPAGNYMPSTLEEKIVCHADNLVSGRNIISLQEKLRKEIKKGHESTAMRIQTMHEELSDLCGIDIDLLLKSN